jgi:AraC-like DNA-binding protein/quercetin dioxygenase-like cupin family protein
MSPDRHEGAASAAGSDAVLVATFPMPARSSYARHTHEEHQLVWTPSGVLTVVTDDGTWVLPPTRALLIPGGVAHETIATAASTMRSAYLNPRLCPVPWTEPQPVAAPPLLAELINYLAGALPDERRARAEALLLDLLEPVAAAVIDAPLPRDPRARQVARSLRRHPADARTLAEWGRTVGASSRTLARLFHQETGIGFERWRVQVRLRAALPRLAAGEPVGNVARRVGYETASAFVAAFRRETGTTPAAYFRT